MNKKIRFTAMVLSLIMMCTLFSGCGKQADTSEQVTLKWVWTMPEQKDSKLVNRVFNEELAKILPNTSVEFIYTTSLTEQWPLWMAGKQSYDLCWSGYTFDMASEIQNGSYTGLAKLIDEYAPNIKADKEEFKDAYASVTVGGEIYAIPCQQPILHQVASLNVPAEYYDCFPTDEMINETNNNYKTTSKAYDLIEKYVKSLIDSGKVKVGNFNIDVLNLLNYFVVRGYDFVGTDIGGAWLCYDSQDKSGKIVNFMETDSYKTFIEYTSKWYDMGWIPDSYALGTTGAATTEILTARKSNSWFGVDEEKGVIHSKNQNGEITDYYVLCDKETALYNGAAIVGSELTYQVIPYTAKNPERAIMLLDLLRDKKGSKGNDLLNLLTYGFEKDSDYAKEYGTYHYTLNKEDPDDPQALGVDYESQPSADSKYGLCFWTTGSSYLCYRPLDVKKGQVAWAKKFLTETKPSLPKTALYQFVADQSKSSNTIEQVNRAITEFNRSLVCGGNGSKNYNAMYQSLISKMGSAGLKDLKKDIQAQADKWMKK